MVNLMHNAYTQVPIGADFTYQGELIFDGQLVTGQYDFEVKAFNALTNGSEYTSKVSAIGILVENGVFTLLLDFGDIPFKGDEVYLEISVRLNGSGLAFETLTPRQKVTSSPYAIHAQFVGADAVTSSEILDGTINTQDLANNSITSLKIADNSISSLAIQNNAISSAKIENNAVGEAQVNATQVQLRVNEACLPGQYISSINQDGTVLCQTDIFANTNVTSADIVDGTILAQDLANGSVLASKLADNSVTLSAMADNAIGSSEIIDQSISASDIKSSEIQVRVTGTCANGKFVDGVNQDGSVSCRVDTFGVTTVTSSNIVDGTIIAADISSNAIINSKLSDGAVTTDKIANAAVGSSKIISSQVQLRINSTCSTGYYLKGVNEDGSVMCQQIPLSISYAVDTMGVTGEHTSIVVRPSTGFPMISYYELQNKDLKIFNCTNTICSEGSSRLLDTSANVGRYSSIALNPLTGNAVISYYDESNKDLKLYVCNDSNCTSGIIKVLDTTGDVGLFTSITTNSQGHPRIAYYDLSNQDLKVHACFTASCTTGNNFTIDSSGDVGSYTSIALRESSGFPVISYRDETNVALKIFDCTSSFCNTGTARTIDTSLDVGTYTSLAVNNSGNPVIGYFSFSNKDLKLFTCSNSACTSGVTRTLDNTGQVGLYTSIAIDPDSGNSIISYFDSTNSALKLYYCNDLTCSQGLSRTVDNAADVGRYSSIAIAANGFPIMSYFDNSNADLKILNCANALCN